MAIIKGGLVFSLASAVSAIDECSMQWPPPDGKCNLDCGATVLGHEAARHADEADFPCQVAFLTGQELHDGDSGADFDGVDHIVTNHFNYSAYLQRNGTYHFFDEHNIFVLPDMDTLLEHKTELLSFIIPNKDPNTWENIHHKRLLLEAQHLIDDHIFVDDGSLEMHAAALSPYRFTIILEESEDFINRIMVNAFMFHTTPILAGFSLFSTYFFNGVMPIEDLPTFSISDIIYHCEELNHKTGILFNNQRINQDVLHYRYNHPWPNRFYNEACQICAAEPPKHSGIVEPDEAFLGIYSANGNLAKREAIRNSWLKVVLARGLKYTFFLGKNAVDTSEKARKVRREMAEYGDIVLLDIPEGYRYNSRKGVVFLNWIAENIDAKYLVKIDDDVYWRPGPLLDSLKEKSLVGYVWGFFDYISPVPRDEDDHFYNPEHVYPFPTFPPYPRGVLRVLSMDIVRRLAQMDRENKLNVIYGDDPCMGVHLRQMVMDEDQPMSLQLDDRDSYRVFAMEPSCNSSLWSKINNSTFQILVFHFYLGAFMAIQLQIQVQFSGFCNFPTSPALASRGFWFLLAHPNGFPPCLFISIPRSPPNF